MRKIDILNKNYEKIGLDTVVYTNKTIDEVCYIDSDGHEWTYREIFETGNITTSVVAASGQTVVGTPEAFTVEINTITTLSSTDFKVNLSDGAIGRYFLAFYSTPPKAVNNRFIQGTVDNYVFGGKTAIPKLPNQFGGIFTTAAIDTQGDFLLDLDYRGFIVGDILSYSNMVELQLNMFDEEPSEELLNIWYSVYVARKDNAKETITLREFIELNMLENPFFDDGENGWFFGTTVTTHSVIDGKLHATSKNPLSTGSNWISQDMFTSENLFHTFYSSLGYDMTTIVNPLRYILMSQGYYSPSPHVRNWVDEGDKGILSEIFNLSQPIFAKWAFGIDDNNENFGIFDSVLLFDMKNFDELMTKETMDYIIALYKKIKYDEQDANKTYFKGYAPSKLDTAYKNKTIDEVVYEGKTLRDIFEHGNKLPNPYFDNLDNITSAQTIEVESGRLKMTLTSATGYFQLAGLKSVIPNGNPFYISFEYEFSVAREIRVWETYNILSFFAPDTNRTKYSRSLIALDELSYLNHYTISGLVGEIQWVDNYFLIDKSMFAIQPTVEQMDTWRDMFLARKDLQQVELTYSDIFEKYNILPNPEFEIDIDKDGLADDWINQGASYEYHLNNDIQQVKYLVDISGRFSPEVIPYNSHVGDRFYCNFKALYPTNRNGYIYLFNGNFSGNFDVFDYWKSYSFIGESVIDDTDIDLRHYINALENESYFFEYMYLLKLDIFDERITDEQLDAILSTYRTIRNIIVEPKVFLITDPVGFGSRYKMKEVGERVYGHELDFENITMRIHFGINYNAYEGFNLMMAHLRDNECIIEYDWGKGIRYGDSRLLQAPKTEKDTFSLLRSRFAFKKLNPFYELFEYVSGIVKNTHEKPLTPVIEFTTSSDSPSMEIEDDDTSTTYEISFDLTGVTKPATIIIDSENKTIKFADGTNAYGYVDLAKETFFSLPYNVPYILYFNSMTTYKWTHKQWVND